MYWTNQSRTSVNNYIHTMSGVGSYNSSNDHEVNTSKKSSNHSVLPHHVIVPLGGLSKVVNANLTNCKECKIGELKLVHAATLGVASNLKLNCKNCQTIHTNLLRQRSRIRYFLTNNPRDTVHKRKKTNDLRFKLRSVNKQITKMEEIVQARSIPPQHLGQKNKDENKKQQFINSALNLRCMLSAYHLGTGGLDIMKHLSMMGCDTNHAFVRNFTRNSSKVNEQIINTCNTLIDKQLIQETKLTIAAKNSSNDTNDSISNDIKQCDDATKIDDLDLQNTVKLTCSYDMGWSKRAGGRIYDSASGHGYLVGVNSGMIVG